MKIFWVQTASFLMFWAVTLGAFGAHAFKSKLTEYSMEVYKTAVLYHFIHALALFAVAWLSSKVTDPKVMYAGICFIAGIILFSGSLYILALIGIKKLGVIAPFGGLAFLAGWGCLMFIKVN